MSHEAPKGRPSTSVVPNFTPVPREKPRIDGWTAEKQRDFIAYLTETGSVDMACQAVGMSTNGAYALRRANGAEEFRAAWIAALDHGISRVEDIAMHRALYGTETPVYSYGKLIGTRTVYNDRLLMFMLRNRCPDRFGDLERRLRPGARLYERAKAVMEAEKKQAELAAPRTDAQTRKSIEDMLDRLNKQGRAKMTLRQKQARDAYDRLAAEEQARRAAMTTEDREQSDRESREYDEQIEEEKRQRAAARNIRKIGNGDLLRWEGE